MNPQEQKQLEDFLVRLTHVGYVNKDPQAAEAIAAAFSHQPDAPYLTVQRCLLLDEALADANARIAELERQQPGQTTAGSSMNDRAKGWLASAAVSLAAWQRGQRKLAGAR